MRWKSQWKIWDLLAAERRAKVVLNFVSSTEVGKRVPAEDDDAVSPVSELVEREWLGE